MYKDMYFRYTYCYRNIKKIREGMIKKRKRTFLLNNRNIRNERELWFGNNGIIPRTLASKQFRNER